MRADDPASIASIIVRLGSQRRSMVRFTAGKIRLYVRASETEAAETSRLFTGYRSCKETYEPFGFKGFSPHLMVSDQTWERFFGTSEECVN